MCLKRVNERVVRNFFRIENNGGWERLVVVFKYGFKYEKALF